MHDKNILGQVWDLLELENTKIAKKTLDELNEERIFGIYVRNDIFYFENNRYHSLTNKCYDYLKKFIKKHFNIKCLYEII